MLTGSWSEIVVSCCLAFNGILLAGIAIPTYNVEDDVL